MTSPHQLNRSLTAALQKSAKKAGEQAPSVRGADWRLATVTAVNAGGTVDADGIPGIRRLKSYTTPAVADVIVISQSSNGNWIAIGPLATT